MIGDDDADAKNFSVIDLLERRYSGIDGDDDADDDDGSPSRFM